MIAEPVLLVVGSVGIAASIYGQYLYWRNGHWSVRSSEPRMSDAGGQRRMRLVSTDNNRKANCSLTASINERF